MMLEKFLQVLMAELNWTGASSTPQDLLSAEDLHFTTLQDGWVIGQGYNSVHCFILQMAEVVGILYQILWVIIIH